jgi:hypothetical protein
VPSKPVTTVAQITGFACIRTGECSTMSTFSTDTSNQHADEFTEPSAGPVPTAAEEAAADRSRGDVDTDRVAEHYSDMTEKGKNVKGEGDVVPD